MSKRARKRSQRCFTRAMKAPRRTRAAAAAGTLLRLGLATGSGAASSAHEGPASPAPAGGGSPQRHAPEHRDCRTHAPARRCARSAVERRLAHNRRYLLLHQHTLLPEALETWPVELFERVLPRHLQIIYRINAEHIEKVRHEDPTGFSQRLASISLIDERDVRKLRMGHLAFVGSHRVNGVSGAAYRADAQDRIPRPACSLSIV